MSSPSGRNNRGSACLGLTFRTLQTPTNGHRGPDHPLLSENRYSTVSELTWRPGSGVLQSLGFRSRASTSLCLFQPAPLRVSWVSCLGLKLHHPRNRRPFVSSRSRGPTLPGSEPMSSPHQQRVKEASSLTQPAARRPPLRTVAREKPLERLEQSSSISHC